jgi:hypothetical protein
MNPLGILLAAGAAFVLELVCCRTAYRNGLKSGQEEAYRAGYEAGKTSADNWWIEAEQQVSEARQKIWMEEQ